MVGDINDNQPSYDKPDVGGGDRVGLGKEALRPPLPKRFYTAATVGSVDGGYAVLLDGRSVRTPKKTPLVVPKRALAEAVASEWAAQVSHIDPASMPTTRIVNTTLDAVIENAAAVAADLVAFAGHDALCYRAEGPRELRARQDAAHDPILAWATRVLGARLVIQGGIVPVEQPKPSIAAIATHVGSFSPWQLAPLHVVTTISGSAVIALAVASAQLSADGAWDAATVDERWQIEHWGQDDEAAARMANRRREMNAAIQILETLF
jgi:chaperone required for assembly of F1-ATPase